MTTKTKPVVRNKATAQNRYRKLITERNHMVHAMLLATAAGEDGVARGLQAKIDELNRQLDKLGEVVRI